MVGNPLLQSVIGSYSKILRCLECSRKEWWVEEYVSSSPLVSAKLSLSHNANVTNQPLDHTSIDASHHTRSLDGADTQEEEEIVDFNQTSCKSDDDNDNALQDYQERSGIEIDEIQPHFFGIQEEISPIEHIESQYEPMINETINTESIHGRNENSKIKSEIKQMQYYTIEPNGTRRIFPLENSQKTLPFDSQEACNDKKGPSQKLNSSYGDESVTTAEATFIAASIEDQKRAGILPSNTSDIQSPAPIVSADVRHNPLNNIELTKKEKKTYKAKCSKCQPKSKKPKILLQKNLDEVHRPKVLVSALSTKDKLELKKCVNNLIVSEIKEEIVLAFDSPSFSCYILPTSRLLQASHIVCGGAEYADIDGSHIICRTFGYLFALAAGLPLFNSNWLHGRSQNRTTPKQGDEEQRRHAKYGISGCVEALQLYAPKRSLAAKVDGDLGTCLFTGYTFFMIFSTIEPINFTSRRSARARQRSIVENDYTKERLVALAQMCSATIIDFKKLHNALETVSLSEKHHICSKYKSLNQDKTLVISDIAIDRGICESLKSIFSDLRGKRALPIVSRHWLIDSIGEFEILNIENYKL